MTLKCGTGLALGAITIEVEAILRSYGVSDWRRIVAKTGIETVTRVGDDQTSLDLGIQAGADALSDWSNSQTIIDSVISVTGTPVRGFPGHSYSIANALGLSNSVRCIDLISGCSGFVEAFELAAALGGCNLIVCQETYGSRGFSEGYVSEILFSDGAAAVVLDFDDIEILESVSIREPDTEKVICSDKFGEVYMDGPRVFEFVRTAVIPQINQVLEKAISRKKTPDILFLHSGSGLVQTLLQSSLPVSPNKMPNNLNVRGNMISASIPALIHDMKSRHEATIETVLMSGFGVGLSSKTILVQWA